MAEDMINSGSDDNIDKKATAARQRQLSYAKYTVQRAWAEQGKGKFPLQQLSMSGTIYEDSKSTMTDDPLMEWGDDEDHPIHKSADKIIDCCTELLECLMQYTSDPNEAFLAALLQWKVGAESGTLIQKPADIVKLANGAMAKFLLRALELAENTDFRYLLLGENREYSNKLRKHAEEVKYTEEIN